MNSSLFQANCEQYLKSIAPLPDCRSLDCSNAGSEERTPTATYTYAQGFKQCILATIWKFKYQLVTIQLDIEAGVLESSDKAH